MIRSVSSLFVLLGLTLLPLAAVAQAPIKHPGYAPEFSAEQILNGNLPRPASPPPLPVTFDDSGFAKERVFHVPPPGVHPRILFGPQDLPGIRERLSTTQSGRQMLGFARKQLANGIDQPGTWEYLLYQDLLKGDIVAFGKLYKADEQHIVSGNSAISGAMKPATKWHHRDPFGVALEIKAFVCLLDNNAEEGARLGKALAAYATYFRPRIEAVAAGPYGDNWWRSMRTAVDGWPNLPYAYDLAFKFMTPEQQKTTRDVLSLLTKGRYSLGMELPSHWRNWNFIGLSLYEAIFSLAIEGEEGYDPRVYRRSVEVLRDYLAYSINPSGMAHESVGYHSAGMSHASFVMIAMANRGDNFFTQSHYRAQLDGWYLQTLEPYGGEWVSDGDLGNFPVSTEPLMVAKYFYPTDTKLDFVYQNTQEARTNNFAKDLYLLEAMVVATDPERDRSGTLVDYKNGAVFNLPNTYVDEHRGVLISRSDWTPNASYLNFECHPDTVFASHDHADRGRFVFSALGRNWGLQDSRPHDTGEASSVLIDNEGQGFFTPYGKWLGVSDTTSATFAGCDASYAYSWKWRKEAGMWPDDDARFKTFFYATQRKNSPALDKSITEYDPSPQVQAYYKNYLAGNPRMWDEDSWVVRQPNNPVQYAVRHAGLVRGPHPYVVIIDDIRKDAATHEYKWLMQLQDDLVLKEQNVHDGMRDMILAEKRGNRRLLIRVFENADATSPGVTEHVTYNYLTNGTPNPTIYRLTVPTRTVNYASKVILYAFHEGEALPASTWNGKAGEATVAWEGATDSLHFGPSGEAGTRVTVVREGKVLISNGAVLK